MKAGYLPMYKFKPSNNKQDHYDKPYKFSFHVAERVFHVHVAHLYFPFLLEPHLHLGKSN